MNPLFTAANMFGSKLAGKFLDPYLGFRFMVEIEGIFAGGFQEVSGLSVELEVDEIKEGGTNDYKHKLPKGVKYGDIVLKRGLLDINMTGSWFQDIIDKQIIERKSGSIRLMNELGIPTYSWDFFEAYPVKWEASGISASSNGIVTESITLAHHGLKRFSPGLGAAVNIASSVIGGLF